MNITMLNPEELTLGSLVKHKGELYTIRMVGGKPIFGPISLDKIDDDMCVLRICDILVEPENEPPVKKSYRNGPRVGLTYKFNGSDETGSIFVDYRPESGGIRVSFNDKESAEVYFNYFREQFYTYTTGASVITVSNIYKDLNIVNWRPEDCDDWGWYTLDGGTCRHISSSVTKNRNNKRFGFTLSKPTKLYESKKKETA